MTERVPTCELLWFAPENVPQNFSSIIYGQRRSGKTTWLKWFLWTQRYEYDRVVVFSSTCFNGDFQQFMNPKLCYPHYDERVMQAILDAQAGVPAQQREKVLIILDDVLDEETAFRKRGKNALVTCYTMGRHYNISVIMCTQYAKSIPTSWRRNVDFALIFYTFSPDMMEVYYKEYGGLLSKNQFMSILKQCTSDHQALVVMPCSKSTIIQKYYQLTRADTNVPKFFIGKPPKEEKEEEPPEANPEAQDMTAYLYK